MKALLDTHAFLWAIGEEGKLSQRAQQFYTSADLWLSVASIWEILIKVRVGKLNLPDPVGPYLVRKMAHDHIEPLPITLDHTLRIESLPIHHRDPFDRILAAQSLEEKLPLLTADPIFGRYQVRVIW
ncbi:MAG TPA: type II toxin-antitoxin system VapC family toxin [Terriglobales bacterium]